MNLDLSRKTCGRANNLEVFKLKVASETMQVEALLQMPPLSISHWKCIERGKAKEYYHIDDDLRERSNLKARETAWVERKTGETRQSREKNLLKNENERLVTVKRAADKSNKSWKVSMGLVFRPCWWLERYVRGLIDLKFL